MKFKVIDYHPEHNTYILQDEYDEVWWRKEEKTKSGSLRYFTSYPDAYDQLMKAGSLNAHSLRATLNSEAEQAINKWKEKEKYKKEGLNDEEAETAVRI